VAEARGLSKELDFATVAGEWKIKGDARRAVEDAARLLGQVLASITVICDPALFVVTGRFARCGPDALEYARAALQGLSPRRRAPEIRVDGPAGPGASDLEFRWIGAIGAARMAIEANTSADDPPSAGDARPRGG
jgi:predicted NBD/HSP70 family sugar kinase